MIQSHAFDGDPAKFLAMSHDFIAVAGMDGFFTYVNPAAEEILGYSIEELLGQPFIALVHPEDQERTMKEIEKLADGDQTLDFQNRYIAKDGSIRHISWTATPLVEEKRIYTIGRDITTRVEVEAALRHSEERFSKVFYHQPVAMQVVDMDTGERVLVNEAFEKLTGYSAEEITSTSAYEQSIWLDPSQQQEAAQRLRDDGSLLNLPVSIRTGTGAVRQVLASGTMLETGARSLAVVSVVDVTDRIQAEEDASRYRDKLRELAKQLTISEERERSRIAGDLHDHVCQMLALLRLDLGAIRSKVSDGQIADELDYLSAKLLKANQDTRQLMVDLSPPAIVELGLSPAISEYLEVELEQRHGIECAFHSNAELKELNRDVTGLLFRSVRELLTNVVKHARARHVMVRLERGASELGIRIEDDGCGFDPEKVSHSPRDVVGFGLFSIQERMGDLGGSLEIESVLGTGSRMTLTLPLEATD